jgi:hypothetical protein
MGFEPTASGTTIRCSNQLSYNHRIKVANLLKKIEIMYRKRNFWVRGQDLCDYLGLGIKPNTIRLDEYKHLVSLYSSCRFVIDRIEKIRK